MVAQRQSSNTHYRLDPGTGLDPAEPLQMAFNPEVKKVFELKRTGIIKHPKTGRCIREFLLVDHFGNNWITYMAVGADYEVHQWPTDRNAYVKPSIIAEHGGLSANLFDKYRIQAFRAFDRVDAQIKQVRAIASQTAGKIVDPSKLELPPAPSLVTKGRA